MALIPRRITTMEETKKRGRGRPPLTEEQKRERAEFKAKNPGLLPSNHPQALRNMEPGDNSKYLNHALVIMEQPPIDIRDPAQVEKRIHWYFEHCANSDMKPTVNGMCNAIGIHRDTLYDWRVGNQRKGTHQEVVMRAYRVLESLWEDYMMNGKINPVSGIFLGKNYWNYADKQEHVITPNTTMPEAVDVATIEAKYAELPDSED
jgi:hypothetical protein